MAILSKSAKRAFFNKEVPTKNLLTTIVGIATSIVSVLVLLNVISFEQSSEIQGYVLTLQEAAAGVIGVVNGLIAMFKATDGGTPAPVV